MDYGSGPGTSILYEYEFLLLHMPCRQLLIPSHARPTGRLLKSGEKRSDATLSSSLHRSCSTCPRSSSRA